jgi:hypothetical protein
MISQQARLCLVIAKKDDHPRNWDGHQNNLLQKH